MWSHSPTCHISQEKINYKKGLLPFFPRQQSFIYYGYLNYLKDISLIQATIITYP